MRRLGPSRVKREGRRFFACAEPEPEPVSRGTQNTAHGDREKRGEPRGEEFGEVLARLRQSSSETSG
jgi:hypothetical protein